MHPIRSAVLCFVVVLWATACASVNTKVYTPTEINKINVWSLEFAYETGSVEQLQKSSGDAEIKVVSMGQSARNLQLRDDLFFTLKDEYSIPMTKNPAEATGRIQLHPIHFYSGGFKVLTVTFIDSHGETLARTKIANGTNEDVTFKDDDDFARYAAKAIAEVIKTVRSSP
jgi:hypothetical protein